MSTFNTINHAFAREALTVTNGAVITLTASVYKPSPVGLPGNQMPFGHKKASAARVCVRAADINFTEEASTPVTGSTGAGTPAGDRDVILLNSFEAISKFKCIAQTASNATLEVVYYA